jgi:acyl-CoA synthetase (AMP-forming)/AMP-acid ligase II
MNLVSDIERMALTRTDAIAFDCGAAGTFTFADLLARTDAFSGALLELGVAPGDRVTVQVDKEIDAVWLCVL